MKYMNYKNLLAEKYYNKCKILNEWMIFVHYQLPQMKL